MIFISYRRDDTAPVARAIAEALRHRFGADKVFLDEDSLRRGEVWTERLENAVGKATVVLAIIGKNWLTAADRFGRRRLDLEDDWVRKELLFAHDSGTDIMPVVFGKDVDMPENEGLPTELKWLGSRNACPLRNDHWQSGIKSLIATLKEDYGFTDVLKKAIYPEPGISKRDEPPLDEQQLLEGLEALPGWEPVTSAYPPRRELRRSYHFGSFRDAIEFMAAAVASIEANPVHHPRWENQYRTVTVYFSTWDAGSTITKYDLAAARGLDEIYGDFTGRAG